MLPSSGHPTALSQTSKSHHFATGPPFMISTAAIDILRFVDQIDCYLWQLSGDEDLVIEAVKECFSEPLARSWFVRLVDLKKPRKVSLNDLRAGLFRDFGVDGWEGIMESRYGPGASKGEETQWAGAVYFHSQQFHLKLSYIDEVEKFKDLLKFRNLGQMNAKDLMDKELARKAEQAAWGRRALEDKNAQLEKEISLLRARIEGEPLKNRPDDAPENCNTAGPKGKPVLQAEPDIIGEASGSSAHKTHCLSSVSGSRPSPSAKKISDRSPPPLVAPQGGNHAAHTEKGHKPSRKPRLQPGLHFPGLPSEREGLGGEKGGGAGYPKETNDNPEG